MASSPAGSAAFFSFSLLAICLAVLLLLRYYLPLRTTPAYVLVPVFLAIALPASIILLVPIDLASSDGTDTGGARGIILTEKVVYKSWRVTYWLTFALTWLLLPLLGEYCDSGYREPKDRVLYSLRSNAKYQLITLGCGIVGCVYFFWENGLHYDSFKGLIMALAYAWGLILAIYLMGHGLVALPRSLFRYASIAGRLRHLQSQAPSIHEKLMDAIEKLDQYEAQVTQLRQRKNGITRDFQEWIEELAEMSSLPESRVSPPGRSANTVPPVITDRYLADLTRKLKRARHAKMRFSDEWDMLVRHARDTQAILDSSASKRLEFPSSQFSNRPSTWLSRLPMMTPYARYHVHAHVLPATYYLLSVLFAIASAVIVWSEVVRSLETKLSLVGLTVVHHHGSDRSQIGFGGQLTAAAWLCYMCLCAFFSFTEVKIWGNRALVRRGTYQESATWYGLQVAKLTVPLSYNFITFVPPSTYKATAFYRFLGKLIDLTPAFGGFSDYFPIFILVPVLASMFNLYGKIKNICGFGDLLEDEDDSGGAAHGTGSWREGRALIEREAQGTSGNTLGLSSRGDGTAAGGYRDDPNGSNASSSSNTTRQPRSQRRPHIEEDADGNFFSDFADRVRNTIDTADFKMPKWMGGGDDSETRRGGASNGTERREGLARWFGGRPAEGRVRLT